MGNEASQQTESSYSAQMVGTAQPWTALSLYSQTSPTEATVTRNSTAESPINITGIRQTMSKTSPGERSATGGNMVHTKDDAVAKVAEMSLTSEELDHINQVLSRVRQLEQREDARIT